MRESAQDTSPLPGQQARDGYLDSLKALALTRMVLWHTYAWPPLSFVIAAMPAMFFASGALAYQSLGRTPPPTFLVDRIVRLLVPLWVYAVVCYVVMAALGYSPSVSDLPNWILPIWDPTGPAAASALWIPLWYLRAYLWLVLLAPVLVAAYRRSPLATIVVVASGFVATELWNALLAPVPFQFRDLAFYGTFFVVGFAYFSVVNGERRSRLVLVVGGAAVAALVAYLLAPPAQGIVNASYALHFFVGIGWLALLLAAARWLASPPPRLAAARSLLCSRSLTIYLYHGPGLLFANLLLEDQLGLSGPVLLVLSGLVVVATCLAAVALFGWVEDLAARRSTLRIWPIRLGQRVGPAIAVAVGAVIVVPTFAVPLPDGAAVFDNPIPPSGQAVIARAGAAEITEGPPAATATSGEPLSTFELQEALDDWVDAHRKLIADIPTDDLAVVVTRVDEPAVAAAWTRTGVPSTRASELVPLASLTKTITGAWVAGGVREGLIDLDAPMSEYVPEVARADEFTVSEALMHVSGLPYYEDDPRAAIDAWNHNPEFVAEPGTEFVYSDLNYFLAALMMERVTGERWEDYVATIERATGSELLFDQDVTPKAEPTHPWRDDYFGTRWASGGLYATLPDAARVFVSMLGDPEVVPEETRDLMASFNSDKATFNYGIGLVPACPCWEEEGYLKAFRYGHDSSEAGYLFDEETGTVTVYFTDEWTTDPYRDIEFLSIHSTLLDEVANRPLVASEETIAEP